MATKPTTYAQWDSNGTNLTATTSGHKTDGWANNEIPTAGEFNDWQKQVADWMKWLLEGEFNDGVTSYSLTGNQTNWDPTAGGTTTNVHTIYVTPDVDGWQIGGLIGGVDKREIQIVNVSTTKWFQIYHEDTGTTAANRITFPPGVVNANEGDVRVPPGASVRIRYRSTDSRWIVVSMTGCYTHEHLIIPGSRFVSAIHTATNTAGGYRYGLTMIADTAGYTIPIDGLLDGDVITGYSVIMDKVSGGTGSYQAWIKSYNATTPAEANESAGTGSQNFGGASGPGTALGETGLTVSVGNSFWVGPAKQYYIAVDPSAACTNDIHQMAYVSLLRPART